MTHVASTHCRVEIVAPNGARFHFPAEAYEQHLLAVETQKDLNQAVGSFTLHFAPVRDVEGRRWDDIIPRRSLVFIDMERPGDRSMPDSHPTVMVGLTDDHSMTETWESAQPRRQVRVSGRELSSVLLDARLVYHPALSANPAYGTLTTQSRMGLRELALAWNPKLAAAGESPSIILARILDYFLFVGGAAVASADTPGLQQPIMQLDLPDVLLSDLLQKDPAQWTLFDPEVVVPMPYNTADAGSIWNYLHLYIDRAFQEFFTRVEDGVCRIHFRGKPFRHDPVASGTRFKTTAAEPTLQTRTLAPDALLSRTTQRQTSQVYNFFLVIPLGIDDLFKHPNFRYQIVPTVITDPRHPSFVGRYGLRVLEVHSPYLAPFQTSPTATATRSVVPLTPPPPGQAQYATMANQVAAAQGIPPALRPWFVANIHQESAFNPLAVSSAGAQGLGQLMPATAAAVGVTNPFDPLQSLTGSARYWNQLRSYPYIGDDPQLIVAAYNAGPDAIRQYKGIPPFTETQQHVRKVTSAVPLYQAMAGAPLAPAMPGAPAPSPTTPSVPGQELSMIKVAQRWSALLAAWYDMGGELFSGTLTVRGHPAWNIGHRLLSWDERGEWEAYIEGVAHRYDMRTGQYLTQLRITRGWYLSATIAQQLREEGQTTVTATRGGPPSPTAETTAFRMTITEFTLDGVTYFVNEQGQVTDAQGTVIREDL